jgi:hypothetical protein
MRDFLLRLIVVIDRGHEPSPPPSKLAAGVPLVTSWRRPICRAPKRRKSGNHDCKIVLTP